MMTAEQAAEEGKTLTFEKVWAMFVETDKKFRETDKKFDERMTRLEKNIDRGAVFPFKSKVALSKLQF